MGGVVDKVTNVGDALTFGAVSATGIPAVLGSRSGLTGVAEDVVNGMFGEPVEAQGGVRPFMQESNLGTTALNPKTGEIISEMSPEMQRLFDAGISQAADFQSQVPGAGQQMMDASGGFLSSATQFDPFAAAEEQFNRLDAILEPGRKNARTGTAAGLLATGRLGGTAGNQAQAAVEGEIERQRQGLLSDQFTAAQGVQDSLVNRSLALSQGGLQQKAGFQDLGMGALSQALGIDSQLQSQLALGGQLTKDQPVQAQQGAFDSILQGGLTAGLGTLIGSI